jgi:multidrug resistance efflux pump
MRGQILLALVWSGAALTCGALLLVDPGHKATAVALTRSHAVRAPESGRIATLAVVPEQNVEAGTILATIEVPGLEQQIAAAEAELRALEAKGGVDQADRGRKFARDLEDARAAWLGARVALEREVAEVTGFNQELGRLQAPGIQFSSAEVSRVQVQHDAAVAAVEARTNEVAALNRAYDDARARAGVQLDGALAASVEAATVKLEALKIQADANTLRATSAGVVTSVNVPTIAGIVEDNFPTPGQWVQAGMPVLTITEPGTQDAVVFVDVGHARDLAPGTEVYLHGQGGTHFEAKVRTVGVAVEPVPSRQLRDLAVPEWGVPVTIQVTDRTLVPGEALSVDF